MKKYITLAALLAAGISLNAAGTTVSLSAPTDDNQAGYTGFDFCVSADWLTLSSTSELPENPTITEFTMTDIQVEGAATWTRFNLSTGFGLAIYEKNENSSWTYAGKSNWLTNGVETGFNKFTFTDGLVLDVSKTYTGVFYAGSATFEGLGIGSTLTSLAGTEYKSSSPANENSGIAVMGIRIASGIEDAIVYGGTTGTVAKNAASIIIGGDATVVPEPSAFGLLAGAGALALVASRRRRK